MHSCFRAPTRRSRSRCSRLPPVRLPLLATRVSGVEDLVEDGVNGWFVTREASDIASRLAALAEGCRYAAERWAQRPERRAPATRGRRWRRPTLRSTSGSRLPRCRRSGAGRCAVMRLAVVSHPCITPINQDFYARVQARTGWEVAIVLPSRWKTEYGRRRAERWPAFHGDLVPLPVAPAGQHPAARLPRARMRRRLRALRPDVVYVHNEPYAVATFQVVRAAQELHGAAIGFYSAQNLDKRYSLARLPMGVVGARPRRFRAARLDRSRAGAARQGIRRRASRCCRCRWTPSASVPADKNGEGGGAAVHGRIRRPDRRGKGRRHVAGGAGPPESGDTRAVVDWRRPGAGRARGPGAHDRPRRARDLGRLRPARRGRGRPIASWTCWSSPRGPCRPGRSSSAGW